MAPLCADPRQVVISLNATRRQALLQLTEEIVALMSVQLLRSSEKPDSPAPQDHEDARQSPSPVPSAPSSASSTNPRKDKKPILRKPVGKAAYRAEDIQESAMMHLQDWKKEFLPKLTEILTVKDSSKIQAERKARQDATDKKKPDHTEEETYTTSSNGVQIDNAEDVAVLQKLYRPIPTTLTSLPALDRREAISCVLLLLLSTGKYSAYSRALVLLLASSLEIPKSFVDKEETEIAHTLMESATADKDKKETMSAEAEAEKRRQKNKVSRYWKVGLASVAGATIVGITGGLAAPLVAGALGGILGGVGLGGVASFLGIFWMNGALVGALFGAFGGKMTGELMDKYAKEVEDFKFIPLDRDQETEHDADSQKQEQEKRRLRVTICINGWLSSEDDITKPWRVLDTDTEVFALRYEMKTLLSLGTALKDLVGSFAWKTLKVEVIKRTALATLWAALWPIQLLAAASNVDNPFNRASNRSQKAGQLLADALVNKVQGERPVTLIGYSLGATAIHACLESLADRKAFGLIDSVVIIGTPAQSNTAHWRRLSHVVSGPIYNVYSENDMVLGFVYRMHSLALGVAGLQAIKDVQGVENLDLSERVSGHLRYPELIGEILRRCGFLGVRAGDDIEKDDVIQMRDDHAQGKPVDFDAVSVAKDGEQHSEYNKVADDVQGLKITESEHAK